MYLIRQFERIYKVLLREIEYKKMEKSDLEILKEKYAVLEKKYNLPSFKAINEDFDIEKLQEKDTDMLAREIRRTMLEKNLAYLRFIEMILNPSQAPMFLLVFVKNIESVDRKALNDLYLELGRYETASLSLDNIYGEDKEADFVKMFFKKWQEVKDKFAKIMVSLDESWDKESIKKEKGYLG